MLPPGTRRTVSKAVVFAGLEVIRRKSLIKRCLKITVSELLNFLKETEVLIVCLVLFLFVYFKAADFMRSIL